MARPQKEGIDYFSLDVDMDQDDKVALIEAKHKLPGFGLLVKLLMKIYKEGYYYRWTEREQLLFASKLNVDISFVLEVIADCLKWEFFNEELFERYKILTSSGIQKRYLEAVKRRKDITMIENYILIDTDHYSKKYNLTIHLVNVHNNSVNVNNNSPQEQLMSAEIPQSKVKESKVKESNVSPGGGSGPEQIEKNKTTKTVEIEPTTENQTFVDESDSPKSEPHQPGFSLPSVDSMAEEPQIEQPDKEKIPYQQIADLWNHVCLSFPKVEKLSKGRKDKVRVRWLELKSLDEFERIFRIMEQSSFLKGDNNNGWKATFDWIMVNDTNYTKVLEGQYANKRGPSKSPPTQPFGNTDKFKDFVL